MRIIDAHTHVFDTLAGYGPRGELRAVGGGRARWANGDVIEMIPPGMGEKSFTGETLAALLRESGVEHAILLQGSFYGFQNDYTLETAREYPDLFTASATFDPFCACAHEIAERLLIREKRRVLKFETSCGGGLMGYHTPFELDGGLLDDAIDMARQTGATLVLDLGSPGMASFQPEAVARIARKRPDLRIVVCHLLAPCPGDDEPLRAALHTLALENVWFDLAAVPWNVYPEEYSYPTGRKFIRMAKEIVGAGKLLWGSDVPSVLTRDTYARLMQYVTESGIFTDAELEGVMAGNACTAYAL